MKLLYTVLLLTFALVLVSCGKSAKSECAKIAEVSWTKTQKIANSLSDEMGKKMLAKWKKEKRTGMKQCIAFTPERRAEILKSLERI